MYECNYYNALHTDSDNWFLTDSSDDLDSSYSKQSASEQSEQKKQVLISFYNYSYDILLISNFKEVNIYRKKYSQLLNKDSKSISNIWSNVKIYVPIYNEISIKAYDLSIDEKSVNKKTDVKCNTKQNHFNESNLESANKMSKSVSDTQTIIDIPNSNLKDTQISNKNVKSVVNKKTVAHNSNNSIKSNVTDRTNKFKIDEKSVKLNNHRQSSRRKIQKNLKDMESDENAHSTVEKLKNTNSNIMKLTSTNNNVKKVEIDDYEEVNEDTEKTNEKSNSDDFDFSKENVSAFVSEIIRYKLKDKHKPSTPVPSVIKKKFNSIKDDQHKISTNSQKETFKLNKHNQYNKILSKAVTMILKNKINNALGYLNEAIALKASDHRHYLNRCYCYLRMNKYNLALEDAEYVLQTSKDNLHIYLANVRAGQASFGLQKYYEAEMYLTKATFIEPENYHTQRELMRVKMANLVEMGFQEKDALFALELHSSTTEAIEYLIENNACSNKSKFDDFEILHDEYNNMIYSSEDDEKPSTVEILNKKMNYKAGDGKLHNNLTNSSKAKPIISTVNNKNNKIPSTTDTKIPMHKK